jgi:hypothetical protein
VKPFIVKFAQFKQDSGFNLIPDMIYDPDSETMLFIQSDKRMSAIDDLHILNATGSYITEAKTDPTRDEPTES